MEPPTGIPGTCWTIIGAVIVVLAVAAQLGAPLRAGAGAPALSNPTPATAVPPVRSRAVGADAAAPSARTAAASTVGSPVASWVLSNGTALPGLRWSRNGSSPSTLAVDGADGTLWVGYNSSGVGESPNLTTVDLADPAQVGEVPGTPNVTALLYDAGTNRMYAAEAPPGVPGWVGVLNGTTHRPVANPPRVGVGPLALALDPWSMELFVVDSGPDNGNVTVVSTATFATRTLALPIGSLGAGLTLTGATFDPSNGDVYVLADNATVDTTYGGTYVFVLNGSTGALAAPVIENLVIFSGGASSIVFDPVDDHLFVLLPHATSNGADLEAIDPQLQALVGNYALSAGSVVLVANAVQVDPRSGELLFVAREAPGYADGGYLGTIDPASGAVNVTTEYAGPAASCQVFDAGLGLEFVGHDGAEYISQLNVSRGAAPLPVLVLGSTPYSGVYDPLDGRVVVATNGGYRGPGFAGSAPNAAVLLDPKGGPSATTLPLGSGIATPAAVAAGSAPDSVAFDASSGELFVANQAVGNATVLDASTGRVLGSVSTINGSAFDLADPARGIVYFGSPAGVVGVDPANGSVVHRLKVAATCSARLPLPMEDLAVDPSSGVVYFVPPDCAGVLGGVLAWNWSNRSVGPILPLGPWSAVAFDPADGSIYVADAANATVAVVNATRGSLEATIPVGTDPTYIAYDAAGPWMVVANSGSDNLTILNASSAGAGLSGAGTEAVGADPVAITVDATHHQLFVAEAGAGAVLQLGTVPVVARFSAAPATADVGTNVTFRTVAAGGESPLRYAYVGLPPGCATSDRAALPCRPTANGTFLVNVTVTDAVGITVAASTVVRVNPAPALDLSATPVATDAPGTVNFGAVANDGTPPYSYAWTFGDGGSGNGSTAAHTYTSSGAFVATVQLLDAVGGAARASVAVTIAGGMLLFAVAPPGPATVGTLLTWAENVSGGIAPYEFSWSFGDGTFLNASGFDGSRVVHAYNASGAYVVTVEVRDAGGGAANQSWSELVQNAGRSAPVAAPFPTLPVAIGAVDALLAVVVLLLWRRRRGARPSSPTAPPDAAPPSG
jgi:YVTN family beta-propeller protein